MACLMLSQNRFVNRGIGLRESDFLALLKHMPLHDGSRGLNDDAAVIAMGDHNIIFTKDMMVQGVHYFDGADPADVAWKLLAVNLSDLAAKGAKPVGVMLGYALSNVSGSNVSGDDDWDKGFADGFADALHHYGLQLIGGDTVSVADNAPRILSLTAIGMHAGTVPSRSGAKDGDIIYVSGPVGDAYGGYGMVKAGNADKKHPMVMAYNRPTPLLSLGQIIADNVSAMMDISDGLLIDVQRMANASALKAQIYLDHIPISDSYQNIYGNDVDSIIKAASWGDDYQLLCAASAGTSMPQNMTAIGRFTIGNAVSLSYYGENVPLPQSLGYEHHG